MLLLGDDPLPVFNGTNTLSSSSSSSSSSLASGLISSSASRINTSMSTTSNDDLNNSINLLIRPIMTNIDPLIPPNMSSNVLMSSSSSSLGNNLFDNYSISNCNNLTASGNILDRSSSSSNSNINRRNNNLTPLHSLPSINTSGMSKPSSPIAIDSSGSGMNQTAITNKQHDLLPQPSSTSPLTKASVTVATLPTTSTSRINLREIQAIKLLKLRKEREEMENIREKESFTNKNKVKKTGTYNVKLRGKGDEFMMDETQRRNQFEKAVLKKVDRKNNILKKMLSNSSNSNSSNNNNAAKNSTMTTRANSRGKVGNEKKILARRLSVSSYDMTQDQMNDINNSNMMMMMNRRNIGEGGSRHNTIVAEDDELNEVMDHYFGNISRINFNRRFLQANKNLQTYPDDDTLPISLSSPRSLYLRETTKLNILPLPLILRKEKEPLGIYLSHHGIGDIRFQPVIKIIDQLPGIHTIDLCDNRLTDITLMPLAMKLHTFKNLTYLDLSYNKIDESSSTIMSFIRNPECQLETLLLNGADVDDHECCNLAEAISCNYSIRTLGLAKNLIGVSELLNVLHPTLITGGESLGSMLLINKTLTELDLSWNSIRLDSAIAIATSLEKNMTLTTLLLAYNSFGDMPSQVLGRALKVNKGLTHLDIESNSITPKAATVLANAISFNETLLKLNINGNTLGSTIIISSTIIIINIIIIMYDQRNHINSNLITNIIS